MDNLDSEMIICKFYDDVLPNVNYREIYRICTVKPRYTGLRFTVYSIYRAIRYTVHISFPPRCTVNRGSTVYDILV